MPPHAPTAASSATPASPRDQQAPFPRQASFRRSLRESGLPEDYLEALDAKRRQLDDSIWKYIASKEREYKNYEKELRQRRRVAQGQEGEKARGAEVEKEADEQGVVREGAAHSEAKKRDRAERETMDRISIAGLKDRRASVERDKDFVGVFTPTFLPALSDESNNPTNKSPVLERTSSTPEHLLTRSHEGPSPASNIERTASDSVVHVKKPTRPSQLVLQHRTSSSGSSADGRLASAMKSPTQPRPKRKRVSLAVGDAIVAPSDNVPVGLTSAPSHSRSRSAVPAERARSGLDQLSNTSDMSPQSSAPQTSVVGALMQAEQKAVASASKQREKEMFATTPPKFVNGDFASKTSLKPSLRSSDSKIDPDGDLFDLEDEENGDMPPPAPDSDDAEDAIADDTEVTGRLEHGALPASSLPVRTPSGSDLYDPTGGIIPSPPSSSHSPSTSNNEIPYLPSSAQTSQMPSKPGFRRPSVIRDPVYPGSEAGYEKAEEKAVEDETYGSSFVRPATKGSFTGGSLGQGFMEMNRERMERLKTGQERQRVAQVRS